MRGELCETERVKMERGKYTKLPLITIAIAAVNIILFLVFDLFLFLKQDEIVYYMALNPVLVVEGKEYWRLITSMFYHFGIDHLMCNMMMLYVVGGMLEPFFGRVRFLFLYFATGIIADGASILYNSVIRSDSGRFVFCAGASGAVYGLTGAFIAAVLFRRKQLSVHEKRQLLLAVFFLLFGSIFDTGVGHDAHFGGFFGGLIIGSIFCIIRRKKQKTIQG